MVSHAIKIIDMNPKQLQSNEELLDFLISLANDLQKNGATNLADILLFAGRFSTGSPSEFLHEAYSALTNLKAIYGTKLTKTQYENISNVIEQINMAFKQIGGG